MSLVNIVYISIIFMCIVLVIAALLVVHEVRSARKKADRRES